MKAKSYILIWLISLIMSYACYHVTTSSTRNTSQERNYYGKYEKILSPVITPATKYVFVLTNANCPSCNIKFAEYIQKFKNDSTAIIIVNARKTEIDISAFRDFNNVFFEFYPKDTFFASTKKIYLNHGKITGQIPVNVETIGQFNY